ncbi:MAG: hypothetical protein L0Z51_03845 [Candidatus Latescibacteria bacterium]|nr:hypothetical protein [Candidatus Latescibacterota bacterium]
MMRGAASRCVVTTVTVVTLVSACTSSIPVPKSEAIEQKEFYRYRMRLHMTNGEELMTKRMTVSDSTVTIYSLRAEDRTVEKDPPLVIPLSEVESIERIKFDDARTAGALIFLSLPVFALWWITSHYFGPDSS